MKYTKNLLIFLARKRKFNKQYKKTVWFYNNVLIPYIKEKETIPTSNEIEKLLKENKSEVSLSALELLTTGKVSYYMPSPHLIDTCGEKARISYFAYKAFKNYMNHSLVPDFNQIFRLENSKV